MAGVSTTHKDYDRFLPKWKRCRDAVAGQDAMRAATIAYLPKLRDETDKDYTARVLRSDYFNGTWRTIDGFGGMAFRKAPTVDVPKAIEPYLEDVNMAGASMDALASETVEEVLSVGRIFVLVDHPTSPLSKDGKVVSITVAAAEKFGLRPSLQLYTAESLINWKFTRINNAWVLSMAVLKECEQVPDGEFKQVEEDRYRVLDLDPAGEYRQRLFKVDEKGNDEQIGPDVYPLMNNKRLDYIPGAIIGTGGRGDIIDEPPLIDLVDKNVAHYQVNADYRHGLHFTALPTLFLSGIVTEGEGKPEFSIGSMAAITSPYPDAKGMFIEFTGQGLGAIEKALDRLERQMAALGAQMLVEQGTGRQKTATEASINVSGENSVLAKIVQAVSGSLEWALGIFAEWAGQSGKITYQINKDFLPTMIDAQTLTALVAAVQAGQLSSESFFDLIQRGDIVEADLTFEEEQGRIDASGPPAPAKPNAPPKEQAA